MVKNFDKSAYDSWQSLENRRQDRRQLQHNEIFSAGYRIPTKNTRVEMETLSDAWTKADGGFLIFDEATDLKPNWPETSSRRAMRIAQGDFTIYREELFAEHEAKGHKLTGATKRKIYAAEKVRMDVLKSEWETEQLRKEVEELELEASREALEYGGW